MINLMGVLYQRIDNAHENATYQNRAPEKVWKDGKLVPTPYPFVVYKILPMQSSESGRDDYTLEVSCWDKSDDTSYIRVIEIANAVRDVLTGFRHLDEHNLIMTDRPTVGYIPDSDDLIKRYDVTVNLMTYRR